MWTDAIQLILSLDKPVFMAFANAVEVAGFAIIIALIIGIPLGILTGFHRFRGQRFLLFILHLWMFLPVVGLGIFFTHSNTKTLISPPGYILWGALLIAPYFSSLIADIFFKIPREAREDAVALGASRWQQYYLFFREERALIWGALSVGIARIFAEIGAFFLILGFLFGAGFPSKPALILVGAPAHLAVALLLFVIGGLVYLGIHLYQFGRENRRA